MKRQEFNLLAKEEQLVILWKHGFVIKERMTDTYSFILYSVCNFFVELRYCGPIYMGINLIEAENTLSKHVQRPNLHHQRKQLF